MGCGATVPRPVPPNPVITLEEMRITVRVNPEGGVDFRSYDAEQLFQEALSLLSRGDCAAAVARYVRIANEFPSSRYVSPSLYNAGLCLQERDERVAAIEQYERLVREVPTSPDRKHADFQLAKLFVALERWREAIEKADTLLARDDLRADERVEAMARRSQALLGAACTGPSTPNDSTCSVAALELAAQQARATLSYYRSRAQLVPDDYFAAASNYVLGETVRLKAQQLVFPNSSVEEQHRVLDERAHLVLDAQREYFNTIRIGHPYWASAAGYRVGALYDEFWNALIHAPVPVPKEVPSGLDKESYEREYRAKLGRRILPLLRHAIRYWELTLLMIERTGIRSEWTERTHADLERSRQRLLQF